MYNSAKNEVLDGIIKSVCFEHLSRELGKLPSDAELAQLYPIPRKSLRRAKRRYKELQYRAPLAVVYLKRAAVVILALLSVTFAVLSTNAEVRAAISDAVTEWYDKYIKIQFSKSDEAAATDADSLEIGYLPEGYEIGESTEREGFREYIYYTDSGNYLIISIFSSENAGVLADNELSEYELLTINGSDSHFVYNKSERYGVLTTGNVDYTVSIMGIAERDEFIKIAENIK